MMLQELNYTATKG